MNAKIVHPQEPIDRSILDRTGDDFSIIPEIEICPKVEIDRANGAFASTTNKIYLAQEFLSENADNLKANQHSSRRKVSIASVYLFAMAVF
jgi:hypothetical protein